MLFLFKIVFNLFLVFITFGIVFLIGKSKDKEEIRKSKLVTKEEKRKFLIEKFFFSTIFAMTTIIIEYIITFLIHKYSHYNFESVALTLGILLLAFTLMFSFGPKSYTQLNTNNIHVKTEVIWAPSNGSEVYGISVVIGTAVFTISHLLYYFY